MLSSLLPLLLSAPVALHAGALSLDEDRASTLLAAVARGLEVVTGEPPGTDVNSGCKAEPECVRAIAARSRAEQIVLLEAQALATVIRVVLTRAEADGAVVRRVETDVPVRPEEWPLLFEGAARLLFPRPARPPPECVAAPPPPPVREVRVLGWVGVGTAAVLGGVATGLRVSSDSARADAEALPLGDPAREPFEGRSNGHGLVSNLLFGAGAAVLAAALVYLSGA